jgi:Icc-related predicted phosphoesterase
LLRNVDLSCCGLFWDGEVLYESYVGSVKHCLEKKFLSLEDNLMYNHKRIEARKRKMYEKGFDEIIFNDMNRLRKTRILKINEILSDNQNLDDYKEKMGYIVNIHNPPQHTQVNNVALNYIDDLPF